MRLAQEILPKKNPEDTGRWDNSGGLSFYPLQQYVEQAQMRLGGKTLFVSDADSAGVFAPFARSLRAISVVFESDALPLFSMPDGVGAVMAAGSADTLKAARFFAGVRRIPCLLFPAEGNLRGVFEPFGEVSVCGKTAVVPLASGAVDIDFNLVAPSLAEAFASVLLSKLSAVESLALRAFRGASDGVSSEEENYLSEPMCGLTAREIIERNARLQRLRAAGAEAGEGETLAELHRKAGDGFPAWRAYSELSVLYGAFFGYGRPRSFVPDYAARAANAKTKYRDLHIPSPEEYVYRAAVLERVREEFSLQMNCLLSRKKSFDETFGALAKQPPPRIGFAKLKILPEHCPEGLSAIIRDFGLMEF